MDGLCIGIHGDKVWYKNDDFHRLNGPSIEYKLGHKWWYQNGKRHRLDGPALDFPSGNKEWYYQGKYIDCSNQEEFERLIKLKLLW